METEKLLFKRMLGLKTLIKTACELDQALSHYITYLPDVSGDFAYEIVIFAHSQVHPAPVWVVKLIVESDVLARVMSATFKMIQHYDKLVAEKGDTKCHSAFRFQNYP
jgi:hypothetical protein